MKKTLLLFLCSISFVVQGQAQQLQYSTWTRFDTYLNDTVFRHFNLNTCSCSSSDGLLVSSIYTGEGNVFTIKDVSGPYACSGSTIGNYTFLITQDTILQFTLVSDACTGRANSLTEGPFFRMPPKTIHVPADFPTIQEGIAAADNFDTVLVAEGIYYEQIRFLGKKPLMVASEYLMDGDTSHIANTIIDGSQIATPATASVVYFNSGEDTTSILCGFTIQGGKGTNSPLWGATFSCGGGIYIINSGASICNNIIQDNEVNDTLSSIMEGACGGGIYAYNGFPGWVIIKNNRIINNRAITNHHVAEGGRNPCVSDERQNHGK
jgi:hypothetical protein